MLPVDLLDGAQLLLPGPLQRSRHEPVFWFDRIILSTAERFPAIGAE
jgi:hypothetical protein